MDLGVLSSSRIRPPDEGRPGKIVGRRGNTAPMILVPRLPAQPYEELPDPRLGSRAGKSRSRRGTGLSLPVIER